MFSFYLLVFFSSLFTLSLLFLLFITFSPFKALRETNLIEKPQKESDVVNSSSATNADKPQQTGETDSTRLTHSLLLKILPTETAKWATEDPGSENGLGVGTGESGVSNKKKKKRVKKKKLDCVGEENEIGGEKVEEKGSGSRVKPELICLYPFTSTSSAIQRKIKQQYDQLVKCNENKGLTLVQVGEFANCLIDARSELQNKSGIIKRKFTITKALLFKADRSSYERIRQQIYKLEMEQKRLEEDAFVYNWLQEQLKLSPAYKKMLEVGACVELNANSDELVGSTDDEFPDISFEELLAQEKKDSFWLKNGRPRNCSS